MFGREQLELGCVPVVVPARCTEINVVARSLTRERVGVGGNARGARAVARRREYIDAERDLIGQQRPKHVYIRPDRIRRLVARSEEAQPAGTRDGRRKCRRRRPTGHRCLNDRISECLKREPGHGKKCEPLAAYVWVPVR